ncbi:MAG: extracellular solute-binding protein [Oscillospiraceae bacterium]|nr:extracellular solute-binding protein [Oscillospiraceae bacterium]
MKNLKRLLSLLLALLTLLSVTACVTPDEPTDPTTTQPPTSGSDDPTDGGEKVYDFEGKTIKIACWNESGIPQLGRSDDEDAYYYSLEHAKEKFNCEVEWVITSQDAHFGNFVQKSLSGEVYADILLCHSWNYIGLIRQDLLVPTTEFINGAKDAEHWNTTTYVYQGENWGIEPVWNLYWPTYSFLVNTKILKELGLEHPQELARRGEWTWEKFREYCALATDPSKEQYGVSCFMLPHVLNTGNNFDYAVPDENGYYHNGFTYEGSKKAGMELLELIEKMSQEDKSIMGTWPDGVEAMNEAINSFKNGKLLFAYINNFAEVKNSGFEDYSIVTIPQGPSSTGLRDSVQAFVFWSLPKYSDFEAEARAAFWMEVKRIWEEEYPDQYFELDRDEIAELYRFQWFQSIDDVQFMIDMGMNMKLEAAANVSWGSLLADDLFGAIIRGDTTPAAVIEELDGEMQSLIDATYNN